ncbi:PP2C family protein-serine/threonine phosphatase, partial [Candidatus Cyanaurora vandensis]
AARCENALKVGGDYYDFIPILDTQRWGLVVGDVMGKGVPAGLIMMMTRSTLRSEVLRQGPPGEILSHLNRVMYPDLETSNRFVTLFYAEYEPSTRRLSYTNAAHPRPLFWRAKTREFFSLDLAGTLIGLTPDTVYTQDTLYLELGDVLVCYTDGFTEAAQRGGPQERFGEEKWTQQVHFACAQYETPAQILNYLYAQIHDFCDGPIDDDMTMIVLKAR